MNTLSHKARLTLAVLAVMAAPAGLAYAGEGNGDPFGLETSLQTVQVSPAPNGRLTYNAHNPSVPSGLTFGNVAEATGSQAEPEPLNALPSVPEIGGVWASHSASAHG